jgi:hypothetical protein
LRFANPSFELVNRRHYSTRNAASRNISAHIAGFHHRTRRHPATGCVSPIAMALKPGPAHFFGGRSRLRFSGMNQKQGSSP